MNTKIVVALDVDDVCLSLMESWLWMYNRDYNDILKPSDITDWDITKFIKPEAKRQMYKYIEEPEVFLSAKPVEGALAGVRMLKAVGIRVVYVTANNPSRAKQTWLKYEGFMDDRKDFYQAYDKSLIKADFLIDDKYENVIEFTNGTSILFTRPWNEKFLYHNRVSNWTEILKKLKERIGWGW